MASLVKVEDKYAIRKMWIPFVYVYMSNSEDYWWINKEFLSKYCLFDTEEAALAHLESIRDARKSAKVKVLRRWV